MLRSLAFGSIYKGEAVHGAAKGHGNTALWVVSHTKHAHTRSGNTALYSVPVTGDNTAGSTQRGWEENACVKLNSKEYTRTFTLSFFSRRYCVGMKIIGTETE